MKCNGKLLTEEQVDMLQFMINNYYRKIMDICSCDVERVLGGTEMELTKLEKVIIISVFAQGLSEQELADYAGEYTLEQLNNELEKLFDNSTPKEMREARVNVLNKFIQDLLEEGQKDNG